MQVTLRKLLCASCSVQVALHKLLCASALRKLLCEGYCASYSAQVALRKLLCASCSAQVALCKCSAQVALRRLLCKLLCASCSAQVALRKLLCEACCASALRKFLCKGYCASRSSQVCPSLIMLRCLHKPASLLLKTHPQALNSSKSPQFLHSDHADRTGSLGQIQTKEMCFCTLTTRSPQRLARAYLRKQQQKSSVLAH